MSKAAFELLKTHPNFLVNIEGNNIFDSSVEVVVCDGFVGNVVLKTSEGVADSIVYLLKKYIKDSTISLFVSLVLKEVFTKLKKQIDYAEYGGTPIRGIDVNAIIGHGKGNAKSMNTSFFLTVDKIENS